MVSTTVTKLCVYKGVKTEFLQHYRPTYENPAIQTFGGFVYWDSFAKLKLNLSNITVPYRDNLQMI